MNEYKVGEWRAELIRTHAIDPEGRLKSRKFAVRKGTSQRSYCVVSVIDDDGTQQDAELRHILAALDAYRGKTEE